MDSHTPETQRKRAEAKQRAEEEAKRREEEARQRAEEINKLKEDAKKLREEITKRTQTGTVVSGPTIENLLNLARTEIELEHYDKADYYYREILAIPLFIPNLCKSSIIAQSTGNINTYSTYI